MMTSLTSDSESISIGSKPSKNLSLNFSKLLSRYSDKGTIPCLCSGSNLSFSKFLLPTIKPSASVSLFRSHAIPKRSPDAVEFGATGHSTIRLFLFFSSSSTKLCNRFPVRYRKCRRLNLITKSILQLSSGINNQ